MKSFRTIIAAAAVLLASDLCDAAGPSTLPQERDTTEIVAAPVNVCFRVPQFWQRREVTGLPADRAFLFDPTPASTKPKRPTMQQIVEVLLSTAGPGDTDVKGVADRARAGLLARNPALKLTKDAAATYAGRAVWTLQWTERVVLKTPPAADGTQKTVGFLDFDRVDFEWLEHGVVCHVGLHADTRFMPSLLKKVETVVRTFQFDG